MLALEADSILVQSSSARPSLQLLLLSGDAGLLQPQVGASLAFYPSFFQSGNGPWRPPAIGAHRHPRRPKGRPPPLDGATAGPHRLQGRAASTLLNAPNGAPAVRLPIGSSTIQACALLQNKQCVLFPWGAAPPGAPGSPRAPPLPQGSGAAPLPLTALHGVQSHGPGAPPAGRPARGPPRAPVASPGPVTALWGLAPLGPSGHRWASPLSGGPGASQRHSFLLPAATPGLQRRSLREILSGPPCSLWPSAHARELLTASREAPAPSAVTGRQPLPQSTAGSVLSRTWELEWGPGLFQDRLPVHHLHSGAGLPGDGTLFLQICISPSGARGLSVRHLRIVGHAPHKPRLFKVYLTNFNQGSVVDP
ncbi:hypothetical protein NDU88_005968 [Pleurodeles waltl]|uniref:Uncharacterized protein n=1 Tax=Pleurodeles waltl TaxID=8319 RepID=A0AAV7NRR0_PLEWA|nr:hypothetical protein NDU88_005968 [Pleurodeles waltl]